MRRTSIVADVNFPLAIVEVDVQTEKHNLSTFTSSSVPKKKEKKKKYKREIGLNKQEDLLAKNISMYNTN